MPLLLQTLMVLHEWTSYDVALAMLVRFTRSLGLKLELQPLNIVASDLVARAEDTWSMWTLMLQRGASGEWGRVEKPVASEIL